MYTMKIVDNHYFYHHIEFMSDNDSAQNTASYERGGHRVPGQPITFRDADEVEMPDGSLISKVPDFHRESTFSPEVYSMAISGLSRLGALAESAEHLDELNQSLLASYIIRNFEEQQTPRSFHDAICKGVVDLIINFGQVSPDRFTTLKEVLLSSDSSQGLSIAMSRYGASRFLSFALENTLTAKFIIPNIPKFIGLHPNQNNVKAYEVLCVGIKFTESLLRCSRQAAEHIAESIRAKANEFNKLGIEYGAFEALLMVQAGVDDRNSLYGLKKPNVLTDTSLGEYIVEYFLRDDLIDSL